MSAREVIAATALANLDSLDAGQAQAVAEDILADLCAAPLDVRLALARELAGEAWAVVDRKLLSEAWATMRACGWHLATAADPISDGVLEAACSDVEARMSDALAAAQSGEPGR